MNVYENGVIREMTKQEIAENNYKAEQVQAEAYSADLSIERKLQLFVEALPVAEKPTEVKEGQVWEPYYSNGDGCIMWHLVPDPYYVPDKGSYDTPLWFVSGMEVQDGKYYIDGDGNIYACIADGTATDLTNKSMFLPC